MSTASWKFRPNMKDVWHLLKEDPDKYFSIKENRQKYAEKVRRESRLEYQRNYRKSGRGQQLTAAKQVVFWMIKGGMLKRQPCEVCGEIKVEAHHKDYNKPYEVVWLCRKHHMEWHKKQSPTYVK